MTRGPSTPSASKPAMSSGRSSPPCSGRYVTSIPGVRSSRRTPAPPNPSCTVGTDEIARDADAKRLAHAPHFQRTEIPPSTWKWEPVANADSSEARKTAIPAMSCGVPTRPIGCSATSCGADLRVVHQRFRQRRLDRAGNDAVDANAVWRVVGGHDAGQPHDSGLGGGVGMPAGAGHGETSRRAGVDDRAAVAALHHQAHAVFAGEIDPAQVDVMRSLPDVDVELVHRRVFADELDGGAGVEHVETPMAAAHLVEGGGDARLVRDVGDQRKRTGRRSPATVASTAGALRSSRPTIAPSRANARAAS